MTRSPATGSVATTELTKTLQSQRPKKVRSSQHRELIPRCQTVNAELYCAILRRLKQPELWCDGSWVLHQDANKFFFLLVTPTQSSPKLKGHRFDTAGEIQREVQMVHLTLTE